MKKALGSCHRPCPSRCRRSPPERPWRLRWENGQHRSRAAPAPLTRTKEAQERTTGEINREAVPFANPFLRDRFSTVTYPLSEADHIALTGFRNRFPREGFSDP